MIRLTRNGVFALTPEVERLRADFGEKSLVQIPHLLDPELLSVVMRMVDEGEWTSEDGDFYREEALEGRAPELLNFIVNRPDMLDLVRRITSVGSLSRFKGRIYRMIPDADHVHPWHNDARRGRRVGMSISLSPRGYRGGMFQLRDDNSGKIIAEIANTGLGDVIFFPVARGLSHQTTELLGDEPKTAFAGWFYLNEESYWDWIRAGKLSGE